MAQGLAEMGANVVLCARKKERCEAAAEELRKLGVKSMALGCDVKDPASVKDVVDATVAEFGRIERADQQRRDCLGRAGGGDAARTLEQVLETGDGYVSVFAGGGKSHDRTAKGENYQHRVGSGDSPELTAGILLSASKGGVIAFTKDLAS